VVIALLVLSLFPALAPAQTGGTTVPVTGGSWYWAAQVGSIEPPAGTPLPPLAPPGALPTPDVPDGDFPASVVLGQSDKESFLQLDSSAIAAGSTVSSLVLTLHEDSAGGNLAADMATVVARAVTGFVAGGDKGKPYSSKPAYDTTGPAADGKRGPDGTWTFDLTAIAARWASGELSNNGVALVPKAPVQGQTYEVVWFGPGGAKPPTVAGSFTPPATAAGPVSPGESVPVEPATEPVSIAPDTSGASLASDVPSTALSSPTAATTPQQPATANPRRTRVRTIGSTHTAPPWFFYLAIIAAIALIALSTFALGDFGEPELDRQGGVLRALERRSTEVPA
jgi:hypothetical protein